MKGKAPSERFLAGRDALIGFAAHRKVAREAVRKSLTLLKNNGALPIKNAGFSCWSRIG